MYIYNLTVDIISDDDYIETTLSKNIDVPKKFNIEYHTYRSIPDKKWNRHSIIIWNGDYSKIDDVLSRIGEKAKLIICINPTTTVEQWRQAALISEDIWLNPMPKEVLLARFSKLIADIKERKELWMTSNYLETIINSVPDLIWFKDRVGAHVKVNDAFCKAVGKTKEDVTGRGHYYIWDLTPEEYEQGEFVCLDTEYDVMEQRKTLLFEEKVRFKEGMRQLLTYKSPIFEEDGEIIGTCGFAHDVTSLQNIGVELEILINSMPVGIVLYNENDEIVNVNDKFVEYFNRDKEILIGQSYREIKEMYMSQIADADDEGFTEIINKTNDDEKRRYYKLKEDSIYDVFGNLVGHLSFCRDITEERRMENQIIRQSTTDFLTGLYNRRYFYQYIHKNRANNTLSFIYIDLDRFKFVNDTYGHQAGDDALLLTTKLMKEVFSDSMITRLGGDEFVITYIGDYKASDLKEKVDKLLAKMVSEFGKKGEFQELTASAGIAQTKDPSVPADELLKMSDSALYIAKKQGKARAIIYNKDLILQTVDDD